MLVNSIKIKAGGRTVYKKKLHITCNMFYKYCDDVYLIERHLVYLVWRMSINILPSEIYNSKGTVIELTPFVSRLFKKNTFE